MQFESFVENRQQEMLFQIGVIVELLDVCRIGPIGIAGNQCSISLDSFRLIPSCPPTGCLAGKQTDSRLLTLWQELFCHIEG